MRKITLIATSTALVLGALMLFKYTTVPLDAAQLPNIDSIPVFDLMVKAKNLPIQQIQDPM